MKIFVRLKMSPPWLTLIHRQVLNSQKCVIGLTDVVVREIANDYGVKFHNIKKARLPFSKDLDVFIPSPSRDDKIVRILFVGSDFHRKGGDVLLKWFVRGVTIKHKNDNANKTNQKGC